ncbi:hypothetical protein [Anaerobacillus sp. 1_MG-2023]|uniref:hypothetical protein n=1 Tax=Anaerobacillus sp. 1_MG-2023 TaxID=3062655 RepID=UPI0026E39C9D|nr:hypothetical protein [Anaerobacillus sp. 1_MG-2023]MDO6658556.1 hypothetical protein [Anaerobacillus sp. 1_MG-2023]
MLKKLVIFFLLLAFSISCSTVEEKPQDSGEVEAERTESVQSIVMKQGYNVLNAIKSKDAKTLSKFVHPKKGVLFSPYGTIEVKRAQVFMPAQLKEFFKNSKQLEWGTEAGRGDPIRLSPEEYFNAYVYDEEFSETEIVTFDGIHQETNSIQNIKDVFPESHYVEFFVPGSEEFEGMDWKSLKLVFSEYNGQFYLIGIIHDQWTP